MTRVIGLDLSSTSTGVCDNGDCFTIAPKGELHSRARHMADVLAPRLVGAGLVVAEAIGTRHVNTAIAIATVHALVWDRLAGRIGPRVELVSPAALKKFATGKGNVERQPIVQRCP